MSSMSSSSSLPEELHLGHCWLFPELRCRFLRQMFFFRGLHGDRNRALGIVSFLVFFAGAGVVVDIHAGAYALRSHHRFKGAHQSPGKLIFQFGIGLAILGGCIETAGWCLRL